MPLARALFFEPSQPCKEPGLSCPIRVTIAIATSVRSLDSTHWGCRATTPAVRLAPGRRSNGLPKRSRFALSALSGRFSPAEKFSAVSEWPLKHSHMGHFNHHLKIDRRPLKPVRCIACLTRPLQRPLSHHPQPGVHSLGMSFDNPSREANP